MKRVITGLLAVILVFSMTACQTSVEPLPTNPPGSNGPSKPVTMNNNEIIISRSPFGDRRGSQFLR